MVKIINISYYANHMEKLGLSFPTKFGWITVEAVKDRLTRLSFSNKGLKDECPMLLKLKSELTKYFEGEEIDFERHKVDLGHYTDFERKVLTAAKKLKYSETITYGNLAKKVGHKNAQRAVGTVLSKNNVPIIIPCHRVIAAHGIGGFTGDLNMKRRLLALENVRI